MASVVHMAAASAAGIVRCNLIRARLLAAAITVAAVACAPPPDPPARPVRTRLDSMVEAQALKQSPEWRAMHYPAADLHGPFPRPALADTAADVNDPGAYYRLGDSLRTRLPGVADRAFYWAVRLDPTMADAYFARWDLRRHGTPYYVYPDGSVHRPMERPSTDRAAVDSLLHSALVYNPFTEGSLQIPGWVARLDERRAKRDPITAGMRAYATGDYRKAVNEWDRVPRKDDRAAPLRIPRAYAWVHLNETDSAVAELTELVKHIDKIQRDSIVIPYVSKDFLYSSIGILRAGQKRYAEARAAYEQALVDNLGFYMAHLRLSAAALLLHDTATALNELETASLIRSDDPMALVFRGNLLLAAGRFDEAERALLASLHADSDFALPRAFLGLLAERRNDSAAARAAYRDYLSHASRTAIEREWVETHLARLTMP